MTHEQEPDALPLRRVALPAAIVVAVMTAVTAAAGIAATRGAGAPIARPGGTIDRDLFSSETPRASASTSQLGRYRWIDREAGLAEIPIDRAIDIVVDGGR